MKAIVYWLLIVLVTISCDVIKNKLVKVFAKKYSIEGKFQKKPIFIGNDKNRKKIAVVLTEIGQAEQPTDIQFLPGESTILFVLEKKGRLKWLDWQSGKTGQLLQLKVLSDSEQGLLGMCFHPNFAANQKFYLNYTLAKNGQDFSRVSEWTLTNWQNPTKMQAVDERVLFEVKQPYANHNAGQIGFGRDGMLYIGWGDGGWMGDPGGNGQNAKTYLGSILRIAPEADKNRPYTIPADNPHKKGWLPEIYAIGIRNPWRFSFDTQGRLIIADVGQYKWEEINIIESGKNYGWNQTEGFHCYQSGCQKEKYTPPIYEYGRDDGNSITGGYVYTGKRIAGLKGRYIFGDFIMGRIWAIDLPQTADQKVDQAYALGKWSILISSFGRDNDGELYLADFQDGKIFRLDPTN